MLCTKKVVRSDGTDHTTEEGKQMKKKSKTSIRMAQHEEANICSKQNPFYEKCTQI